MLAVRKAFDIEGPKPKLRCGRFLTAQGTASVYIVRELPGTPDIVLLPFRMVVQVNGCFWHQHD